MSRLGNILLILFIFFSGTGLGFAGGTDTCLLITDDFPPYSFYRDGRLAGMAVDIVNLLMKDTGFHGKIDVLPWKRAIDYASRSKVMLFPFTRMPYREKKYRWIGPIAKDRFVFAVCREDKGSYASIESFRDLEIGVVNGTPTAFRLRAMGFDHLQVVNLEKQNAMKLIGAHRIDAWYASYRIIRYTLKSLGLPEKEIRFAFSDIDVEMYIGASLGVPDEMVAKWQHALDAMKADGRYRSVMDRCARDWEVLSAPTDRFTHTPRRAMVRAGRKNR